MEKQVLLLWLRNVLCNDDSSSRNYAKNVMWLYFKLHNSNYKKSTNKQKET